MAVVARCSCSHLRSMRLRNGKANAIKHAERRESACVCVSRTKMLGEFVYVSVSVVCVGWHSMHLPRLLLMGDECAVDGSRWQ